MECRGHSRAATRPAPLGRSNPSFCAIKVAAFVYQDKGGYFMLFAQKKGFFLNNRASDQPRGCSEVRFFHFQGQKAGVLLFVL